MSRVGDAAVWSALQRTQLSQLGWDSQVNDAFRTIKALGAELVRLSGQDEQRENPTEHVSSNRLRGGLRGRIGASVFHASRRTCGKVHALIGFQDIDIDDAPEFSRRYMLQGESEADLRSAFQPELLALFAENRDWFIEGRSTGLILYKPKGLLTPTDMKQALLLCSQVIELLSQPHIESKIDHAFVP